MAAEYEEIETVFPLLFLTAVIGIIGIVIYIVFFQKNEEPLDNKENEVSPKQEVKAQKKSHKPENVPTTRKKQDINFTHPLLLASLKGHTSNVLGIDISSNGKFLSSCSEDRTARLWNVKDFMSKDHRYTRVNIEFDHATSISMSPDSRAFIVSLANERTIRVFKIHKKKDGGAANLSATPEFDFPKIHKSELINVVISSNGRFIMSASKDTEILIWSLKGDVLETLDTLLIYNTQADVSPCGNLVAACGFTSDVRLWQVTFNKNGDFARVTRAFDLKGHSAGVLSFSFANDSKRMATVSKDGTWKVWDIDVEYVKGQEAYLLHTGSHEHCTEHARTVIALSHDYFTVAIASKTSISFYNCNEEKLEEKLTGVHKDNILSLTWHADSRQLFSAGGHVIRAWHNTVGARASVKSLKEKLPKAKTDSMKERIQQQIAETEKYLASFEAQ